MHQTWVCTNKAAALDGPIVGAGVHILVPNWLSPVERLLVHHRTCSSFTCWSSSMFILYMFILVHVHPRTCSSSYMFILVHVHPRTCSSSTCWSSSMFILYMFILVHVHPRTCSSSYMFILVHVHPRTCSSSTCSSCTCSSSYASSSTLNLTPSQNKFIIQIHNYQP
jgi:hypothetical protein